MANADNKQSDRDDAPHRGGQQGDIGQEAAQKTRHERDPEADVPNGPESGEPASVPTKQLPREDEDEDESIFTGDDAGPASRGRTGQPANITPEQAIAPEGSVGGRSGTGQARTHRPFDETDGKQALGQPIDPDSDLPEPRVGDSYQSGGTHKGLL